MASRSRMVYDGMKANTSPQQRRRPKALRLFALAVAILLTAAACSSAGNDEVAAVSSNESAAAAPASADDDTMEDDAMADEDAMEEDAMEDDAMEDDAMEDDAMEDDAMEEDAMADDAMADDAMADDAMADEDAMEEDAMADEDAMEDDAMADEDAMEDEEAMADESHDDVAGLALDFDGLEPLGDAAVYEGWVIVDDAPVTTGRFNIDADGNAVGENGEGHVFDVPADVDPTAVVITIEPAVDPDPAPAATKVLAGDIVDGVAELTIAHPAALGTDFADAAGTYILGTPTDGDGNNELSGVWFIDLPLAQGLNLPELPAGWAYEGWAVIDGVPVSTGRFVDPGAADDFDGFSGDQPGPNYPGEDFIVNAPDGLEFPTDLTNATIVISVEPDPDDSPAPFALKPLVSEVADGIGDHEVQTLGAGPAAPTGLATLG